VKPVMGVVADDVTGANDIGIMFAKRGYRVHVYTLDAVERITAHLPDICIVNTNSRLDNPQTAYKKVYAATRALKALGCTRFHNKTCSVFRGNIGAEFDAMLDALGLDFAVVVLGFPKNGRTTVGAVHYVRGARLEESEFRRDPVHPMTRSNLVEILSAQTARTVGHIDHTVIEAGGLRERLAAMRSAYNYVILDVTDQEMLHTIAGAVSDEPVLCGSSAIAEELPAFWSQPPPDAPLLLPPPRPDLGILCVAGSLMPQTAAQIEHLRRRAVPVLSLDTLRLFDPQAREREIARLIQALLTSIQQGEHIVLHSGGERDATQQAGAEAGLSDVTVSRLVSETLADVTARVLAGCGQNRLVVAGGETSDAVCERLGIDSLAIYKEIQPGLPSCISLNEPPLLLVLKSGSFGSPDFFEHALRHLQSAGI
jgi:uncharacterized protein YgbK (DUF1537 family)